MPDPLDSADAVDATEFESVVEHVEDALKSTARASEEKPATFEKPQEPNETLIEDLTKKAHELDAVRKSVEDAASISGTLWLSYLFTLLYFTIAAGAVTHQDLLLENAVRLPFLNVELPLVAFFALSPILFVISHAYTLMHFVMLAAKVGTYDAEHREKVSGHLADATRLGLRRQLPSNIFVQFLAGPSDIREGGLGSLLKAVAWISLVIGPVLLLLLIQIQFLPYHLESVTWIQRFALLADLVLMSLLWPAILGSRSAIRWPRLWRHPITTLACLVPLVFAFTTATFPGEWMDEHVGKKGWIPSKLVRIGMHLLDPEIPSRANRDDDPEFVPIFYILLFNGDVNDVTRRRESLFSNTLVLPGFDVFEAEKIDDPKKLDDGRIKHSINLRGRHLEGAVLDGADLRKADLFGAQLQRASLYSAQLQGASLGNVQLQDARLAKAQLQGVSLQGAQLQGVSLEDAQLQGVSLEDAQLQGVSLELRAAARCLL